VGIGSIWSLWLFSIQLPPKSVNSLTLFRLNRKSRWNRLKGRLIRSISLVGASGEETLGAGDKGEGDFAEGVGAEVGALVGAGDEGDGAFGVGAGVC
jgi:hypothetical protein